MTRTAAAVLVALALPVVAWAQSMPATITLAPEPQPGAFCYYAGLAYSENALLAVDVPYRRDSPEATQKELMRCLRDKANGSLGWKVTDLERPSTLIGGN